MSNLDTVAAAVKDRAHSFKHIRRSTGLRLSDNQFLSLISENEGRLKFTRIKRVDANGNLVRPGWPAVRLQLEPATGEPAQQTGQ
jgi:hypothetical protein